MGEKIYTIKYDAGNVEYEFGLPLTWLDMTAKLAIVLSVMDENFKESERRYKNTGNIISLSRILKNIKNDFAKLFHNNEPFVSNSIAQFCDPIVQNIDQYQLTRNEMLTHIGLNQSKIDDFWLKVENFNNKP